MSYYFIVIKSEFICNENVCEVINIQQKSKDADVDIFNNKTFEQDHVKEIKFINCSFLNLPINIFNTYPRITKMNAGKSDLVFIKKNTFQSAKALIRLDLSFNNLKNLSEGIFIGAVVLEDLNLSNNYISIIEVKALQSLVSLEKINLSKNNISIFKKNYFFNLIRLHEINLSFNKLTYIEEGSFDKLTRLFSLNLSYNLLTEFTESLKFLQILDIQSNKLTTITIESNLVKLNAQENEISNLKIVPNYSNHLNFLNISYNKLDNISNMSYLHSLTTIDLSFNEFREEIRAEALNKLVNLQYLYLEGNNLIKFQYNDLQLKFLKEITLSTINFDCFFLKSMIVYFINKKIKFNGNLTSDCGQLIPATTTISPNGPTESNDDNIEKNIEILNKKYRDLTIRIEYLERNISFKIILGLSTTLILLYIGYRLFKFYTLNLRYRNHQPLSDTLTETFDVAMHPM